MKNIKQDDSNVLKLEQLLKRASVKFRLLDYDAFSEGLGVVKSTSVFEPNSKVFHPDGLFSEKIFGPVTDLSRYTTFGCIELNTVVIHSIIYAEIIQPNRLYVGILSGRKYATWEKNDFVLADSSDKRADTGYSFFVKHLAKIAPRTTDSLKNRNKELLISKYRDMVFASKMVVLPAGLRDIRTDSGRMTQDDINKKYIRLISYANGLSNHALSEDAMFDDIRFSLQTAIHEIFKDIYEMMEGKNGFLQEHYGKRKVALSTRNVASVEVSERRTIDDPLALTVNQVALPMMNAIKAFQPFIVKFIRKDLYGEVLGAGNRESIAVTDMSTFNTSYIEVNPAELMKYTDGPTINKFINQFKHAGFRSSPVSITSSKGVKYCLLISYTEGNEVFVAKNRSELEGMLEKASIPFELNRIHPLTWAEAISIALVGILAGKHVLVTRYPVTGDASIFTAEPVPISTIEFISATVHFNDEFTVSVPRYPIANAIYRESIGVSSSRLAGLGADFDGDMLNCTGIWGDEANREIDKYLDSMNNLVSSDFTLNFDTTSDITKLVLFNLSK